MEERFKNPDNRIIDVFIVYARTRKQSRKVQNKMNKMGFFSIHGDVRAISTWECYFVAQMCHSNDEFNGNKFFVHESDLGNVYASKEFSKSVMKYKDFIKI